MTEEIKEILDNLYRYKDEDYMKYQPEDILTIEDVWLLLDYITNLQEENKELLLELSGYRQAILNDDKLMNLKSRIDKAIEYIKAVGVLPKQIDSFVLLNILQGSDEE